MRLYQRLCRVAGLLTALCVFTSSAAAGPVYLDDPIGDTFGGAPQLDISTYSGDFSVTGTDLTFTVNFTGPISPPSAFAPDSAVGFIDIDTDRNSATGDPGAMNALIGLGLVPGPNIDLGAELTVDLFSEVFQPGFVDILDPSTFTPLLTVPITFGPQSFSFNIPLSFIGTPLVNYGITMGTFGNPTDRAPNGVQAAVTTPEPSSLLLFGVVGAAACLWRRRTTRPA